MRAAVIALVLSSVSVAIGSDAGSGGSDYFYTHFHAQPLKNWLNDPNGLMYFAGKYHLFFQYNPNSYSWGDMHWYHMVSDDMLRWEHLPVALAPDHDYDCGGIFSGSATVVRNATTGQDVPVLTYSVACGKTIVNAVPADITDPKLVQWTKPDFNPVIPVPPSVTGGFRDPTTAWQGKDGVWRLLVGCGNDIGTCQFKSKDFTHWTYVGAFHSNGGGMWECPDFFNIPGTSSYLLKASVSSKDWWAVGEYHENTEEPLRADSFVPRSADILEGGQLYDYGQFYASKAFYDPKGKRQVLIGWVSYHCAGTDWSGVQTFPRTVELDPSGRSIVTNPIKEIETLRASTDSEANVLVKGGATHQVPYSGAQLDVEVTFMGSFSQASSFGVRALVSKQVAGFQTIAPAGVALTVQVTGPGEATLQGQPFKFEAGKPVTLRVLVDHSIVEGFAQQGRAVSTLPYCPPSADATGLEIFNSGSDDITASVMVHQLKTANVIPVEIID